MKKVLLCLITGLLFSNYIFALEEKHFPDTVKTGVYVTSIHNIDFQEKEYVINLWIWFKYKNKDFDFSKNLEIPQAKTFTQSYLTIDTTGGKYYVLMKLQCVMKDSWEIQDFPFDRQTLRLSVENSQFDKEDLVFVADTVGNHFDPKFTISSWNIDKFTIDVKNKLYETAFGDESVEVAHSEYSSFNLKIEIDREAMGLFWKMFLGMFVSFFIAYTCSFIHVDRIDSRFGLSVGALFAVIANKYVVDSSLPESVSFTLVDTLHDITLFFILIIIVCTAYTLKLIIKGKNKEAVFFDKYIPHIILLIYVGLNIYFISKATS